MSFPRYPKYKDSGVEWLGEVPEHWNVDPIKRHVSKVESGTSVNASDEPAEEGKLGVLKTSCVYSGLFRPGENKTVVDADLPRVSCPLKEGTIIVSRMNTPDLIGSAGFVTTAPDNLFLPDRLWQIAFSDADARFVHFWTLTGLYRTQVESACTGTSPSMKNLGQDQFGQFIFPNPPVAEQTLIVRFLTKETEKIDELVAEQQRLMELLKEKRHAVISHAVTKGLNPYAPMKPSGIEWLGDVPAHWHYASLTRISSRVVVGIAEAATHAYADTGIPILRSTNIRAGKIIGDIFFVERAFADERCSKLIHTRDLVTVRTGNAGVTAVIPPELDGCQCFTMLITTLSEGSSPEYYCYWMNSISAQCYFALEGWGTAQVNISVPILKSLPVPIPSPSEQELIASYLDNETARLDALTSEAQKAIDLLQERRTALISAAVTGQIDVRKVAAS